MIADSGATIPVGRTVLAERSVRRSPRRYMRQADRAGSTASVSSGRDARRSRPRLCEPWEMNLRVPDVVANAAAACGAGGWLRDLPGLIAELEAELVGLGGLPLPALQRGIPGPRPSLADGTPAVLNVLVPQDGAVGRHEITMLRLTGGRGCVGLFATTPLGGALLLEGLGPSLYELGHPLAEQLEILVTVAATVWRSFDRCRRPPSAFTDSPELETAKTRCP